MIAHLLVLDIAFLQIEAMIRTSVTKFSFEYASSCEAAPSLVAATSLIIRYQAREYYLVVPGTTLS